VILKYDSQNHDQNTFKTLTGLMIEREKRKGDGQKQTAKKQEGFLISNCVKIRLTSPPPNRYVTSFGYFKIGGITGWMQVRWGIIEMKINDIISHENKTAKQLKAVCFLKAKTRLMLARPSRCEDLQGLMLRFLKIANSSR